LSIGQEVDIHIESVPGLKLQGMVDRIAPQTTIKNNIKGYAARIALNTNDPRVLPGMTANLSIPVASSENALAVPLAAVFTEQGERFVFVQTGEKLERRFVQVGIYDYDYAEVLGGLSAGDVVALQLPPGESLQKLIQLPAGDRSTGITGPTTVGARTNGASAGRPAGQSGRPGGGQQRPGGGRSGGS